MTEQSQIDAMANILGKLDGSIKVDKTVASQDETKAMADVLQKLQKASSQSAHDMVTESRKAPDLGVALQATKTEEGVSISYYDIRTEKKIVHESLRKTFYTIYDNKTKSMIYEDLGLFESAMGIVKHMLYTKHEHKIDRILELDAAYIGAMLETYSHKTRLQRLDESSVQFDVVSAKYSNCKDKMASAKLRLLKSL